MTQSNDQKSLWRLCEPFIAINNFPKISFWRAEQFAIRAGENAVTSDERGGRCRNPVSTYQSTYQKRAGARFECYDGISLAELAFSCATGRKLQNRTAGYDYCVTSSRHRVSLDVGRTPESCATRATGCLNCFVCWLETVAPKKRLPTPRLI